MNLFAGIVEGGIGIQAEMNKLRRALLIAPLVVATSILPATAQSRNGNYNNRNDSFHNGVRNGGRGGDYYNSNRDRQYNRNRYNQNGYNGNSYNPNGYDRNGYDQNGYDRNGYDREGHRRNQGGIGPGKGALIGAGGGAVLGALFGGGLKGTIIGGAAGAGIGAIIGKAHQDKKNDDYNRR